MLNATSWEKSLWNLFNIDNLRNTLRLRLCLPHRCFLRTSGLALNVLSKCCVTLGAHWMCCSFRWPLNRWIFSSSRRKSWLLMRSWSWGKTKTQILWTTWTGMEWVGPVRSFRPSRLLCHRRKRSQHLELLPFKYLLSWALWFWKILLGDGQPTAPQLLTLCLLL